MYKLAIRTSREKPPIGNTKRKKRIKIPMEPKDRYAAAYFSGSKSEKILDPSSGGIGNKLKIARIKFMRTTIKKNSKRGELPTVTRVNLKSNVAIIANKMFVAGPARETSAISFLPSFKLKGSTGTGFAPPKITGDPPKISISGKSIVIKGSIWRLGSRVSLPKSLAVGSPSLSAT